jgi:putative restriction endonuclease
MLDQFGSGDKPYRTEYPFWRLQNDQVWEVDRPAGVQLSVTSSGDALRSELLQYNVQAGFPSSILTLLDGEPGLVFEIANEILNIYFPGARHQAILEEVGLA